jgi:predicted RNase H-like nuclease (RuvC/YqgF family)
LIRIYLPVFPSQHKYDADVSKLKKEIEALKTKVAGHEAERARFAEAKDKTISELKSELTEQRQKTKSAEGVVDKLSKENEALKNEAFKENNDSLSVTGRSSLNVSITGGMAMGRGTKVI